MKDKCHENRVKNRQVILNLPKYFLFNINWKEIQPKLEDICKLYMTIPSTFTLVSLFDQDNALAFKLYELHGLICYANSHYICLYKKMVQDQICWVSYNDTILLKLPKFKDVIIYCLKMRFHPVMILYNYAPNGESLHDAEVLSAYDQDKILGFCHSYDHNNENTYKRDELFMSRLRPSMEIRKKPEEALEKYMTRKITDEDEEEEDIHNLEGLGVYIEDNSKKSDLKKNKKTKVVKDLKESPPTTTKEEPKIDIQKSIDFVNNKPEELKLQTEPIDVIIRIPKEEAPVISNEDWVCHTCKNMNSINESLCISKYKCS